MKIQKSGTPNPISRAPTSVNAVEPVPTRTLRIAVSTPVICDRSLGACERLWVRLAGGFRGEMTQVSLRVDSPLAGDFRQLGAHRPAVGPLLAGVVGGGALEGH